MFLFLNRDADGRRQESRVRNRNLAMGNTLLKKTGARNLFMVFGEQDMVITHLDGEQLQVEIKGLDIYDPTIGMICSSSTDNIARWFIDGAYNEESFFIRQAYFTGRISRKII